MRTLRALIAVAVVSVAGSAVPATAQAPTPRDPSKPCPGATNPLPGETCGDHYLESVRVTLGDITRTLQGFSDSVDSSKATTQADIFRPGGNRAGPREPTTCGGAAYGKTVWYDLNPNVDGDVLVQAVGTSFDPVISIVRYDVRDEPNFRPVTPFRCSNQRAGASEQMAETRVRRGRGYSFQIGGLAARGGPLDVDVNFTPYRVRATSKIAFQLTPRGIRLVNVRVNASRRSRVEVSCKGCGRRVKRGRRVRFNFRGKELRAGSNLAIRVTRGGEIGTYIARRIRRGRAPTEVERCLQPGSRRPRRTCG